MNMQNESVNDYTSCRWDSWNITICFLENSDGSTRGVYGSYMGTMLFRNGFIDEILQLRNLHNS